MTVPRIRFACRRTARRTNASANSAITIHRRRSAIVRRKKSKIIFSRVVYLFSFVSGPSQFLLLAEDGEIHGVNLSSTATNPVEAISRIPNVSAHGIDYDAKTEMIYWTRPETGEIWSSRLNDTTGKSRSVVNTDITLVQPTAIAVDWMSRLLYYTEWNGNLSTISVISFDGTMKMTLIDSNLTEPASIEVDPETGYMFWTDTGVHPRVELAYMNGENRRSVYPEGFVQLPTAVTFNRRDRMIFHCDARADIVRLLKKT